MATLPALLEAIAAQDDSACREIVIVDSSSSDGTAAHADGAGARVVSVTREEFNHGTTRNGGIAATRGELIVLTVQDARPVGRDWLSALLEPLRTDPRIAGSFARQIPRSNASPLARFYLDQWVAAQSSPRTVEMRPDELNSLAPLTQLERCAFDNVCSCIRRSVWERFPFPTTAIAEDIEWCRTVLLAGFRIAFQPEAQVEHSHDRSARYELTRTWMLHQRLHDLFGVRTIPDLGSLVRSIISSVRCHAQVLHDAGIRRGSAEWRRAMALALAWPLGQFLGGWTAARGRHDWRLKGA
jgi:rhamnosyltransferase